MRGYLMDLRHKGAPSRRCGTGLVLRLLRELSRRGHHQEAHALALGPPAGADHLAEGGEEKGEGLAAARGGDADDVLALDGQRPSVGLEGGWGGWGNRDRGGKVAGRT